MEVTNRVAIINSSSNPMVVTNNKEATISSNSSNTEAMVRMQDMEALPSSSNISSNNNPKVNTSSRGHPREAMVLLHRLPHRYQSGKVHQLPMVKPTITTKGQGRQLGKNLRACHRVDVVAMCMNSPSMIFFLMMMKIRMMMLMVIMKGVFCLIRMDEMSESTLW